MIQGIKMNGKIICINASIYRVLLENNTIIDTSDKLESIQFFDRNLYVNFNIYFFLVFTTK